jgi:hypothetical protein
MRGDFRATLPTSAPTPQLPGGPEHRTSEPQPAGHPPREHAGLEGFQQHHADQHDPDDRPEQQRCPPLPGAARHRFPAVNIATPQRARGHLVVRTRRKVKRRRDGRDSHEEQRGSVNPFVPGVHLHPSPGRGAVSDLCRRSCRVADQWICLGRRSAATAGAVMPPPLGVSPGVDPLACRTEVGDGPLPPTACPIPKREPCCLIVPGKWPVVPVAATRLGRWLSVNVLRSAHAHPRNTR